MHILTRYMLFAGLMMNILSAHAGMLPFHKHRLLIRGMSAGEVLYRVGPPDFRQLRDAYWTNKQSWYYIPSPDEHDPWQTVIHFDAWGNIQRVDREKIIRDLY